MPRSGAAAEDDGSDLVALFVIQHDHRSHQIRTALATPRIGAMAEAARRDKRSLAALDGLGSWNRTADQSQLGVRQRGRQQRQAKQLHASASLQNW